MFTSRYHTFRYRKIMSKENVPINQFFKSTISDPPDYHPPSQNPARNTYYSHEISSEHSSFPNPPGDTALRAFPMHARAGPRGKAPSFLRILAKPRLKRGIL